VAGGAAKLHMHRRPAVAVLHDDRRPALSRKPAVAPLHERHQHGKELEPALGEPVLEALALSRLPVGRPPEEIVLDERAESVREDVPGS